MHASCFVRHSSRFFFAALAIACACSSCPRLSRPPSLPQPLHNRRSPSSRRRRTRRRGRGATSEELHGSATPHAPPPVNRRHPPRGGGRPRPPVVPRLGLLVVVVVVVVAEMRRIAAVVAIDAATAAVGPGHRSSHVGGRRVPPRLRRRGKDRGGAGLDQGRQGGEEVSFAFCVLRACCCCCYPPAIIFSIIAVD
jgi:hypothetical protein